MSLSSDYQLQLIACVEAEFIDLQFRWWECSEEEKNQVCENLNRKDNDCVLGTAVMMSSSGWCAAREMKHSRFESMEAHGNLGGQCLCYQDMLVRVFFLCWPATRYQIPWGRQETHRGSKERIDHNSRWRFR